MRARASGAMGDDCMYPRCAGTEGFYKEWFPEQLCRAIIFVSDQHLEGDLSIHDVVRLRLLWARRVI